jgi:hypothetical protein
MKILMDLAEQAILDAQRRGDFDNLPGQGRPLPPKDGPAVPEHLRMAYTVLKNAGYVPEEIQAQKDIHSLIECLERETDESRKMRQIRKIDMLMTTARIRFGGLLLEENQAYFEKVVARVTLNEKKES